MSVMVVARLHAVIVGVRDATVSIHNGTSAFTVMELDLNHVRVAAAQESLRSDSTDEKHFSILHSYSIVKHTVADIFCSILCITQDLYSQKSDGLPFNISSYALLTHLVAHV